MEDLIFLAANFALKFSDCCSQPRLVERQNLALAEVRCGLCSSGARCLRGVYSSKTYHGTKHLLKQLNRKSLFFH